MGAHAQHRTLDRAAKRTHTFTESVIREMTRVARQHDDAVNLAQGFPDFAAPDLLEEAAAAAIRADVNRYAITWGAPRSRRSRELPDLPLHLRTLGDAHARDHGVFVQIESSAPAI